MMHTTQVIRGIFSFAVDPLVVDMVVGGGKMSLAGGRRDEQTTEL